MKKCIWWNLVLPKSTTENKTNQNTCKAKQIKKKKAKGKKNVCDRKIFLKKRKKRKIVLLCGKS